MPKPIHERVRETLRKQELARRKAEQAPIDRRIAARIAADVRIERGIDRALQTGVAKTRREQDALDREMLGDLSSF
jgi:hypothetical protein